MSLVFVPTTLGALPALAAGTTVPVGTEVFVPEDVGPEAGPDDIEAAQFDSLCEAAAASVAALVDSDDPPRRVVLVVAEVDTAHGRTTSPFGLREIEAVYVDEDAAMPDVAALLASVRAGEEPSDAAYDAVEERHLLWYAPSELGTL